VTRIPALRRPDTRPPAESAEPARPPSGLCGRALSLYDAVQPFAGTSAGGLRVLANLKPPLALAQGVWLT